MKINFLAFMTFIILFPVSNIFAYDTGPIQVHGFLSQGFLQTDENNYLAKTKNGTFQFNEFGINFSTDLTDNLRAGIQFFGRDLGPTGNDEIKIDWAFMDYSWKDWMGLRIGKLKYDYGLYNETREMDMLRTSIMLPQSIYQELWRDTFSTLNGIGTHGVIPALKLGSFNYDAQIGALSIDSNEGFAKAIESSLHEYNAKIENIDNDYSYTLNITWNTPVEGLKTKYSWYEVHGLKCSGSASGIIPYDFDKDGVISSQEGLSVKNMNLKVPTLKGYIASLEYVLGDFNIAAEYSEGSYRQVLDMGYGYMDMPTLPYKGWYVSNSYKFNRLFSAAISYSDYVPNSNDENGDKQVASGNRDFQAWLRTWTLSTRFDINNFWVVKMEGSWNDGFGAYDSMGNKPHDLEQYWWLFAAKATVSF